MIICARCGKPFFGATGSCVCVPTERPNVPPLDIEVAMPIPPVNNWIMLTSDSVRRIVAEEVAKALREHGLIGDSK